MTAGILLNTQIKQEDTMPFLGRMLALLSVVVTVNVVGANNCLIQNHAHRPNNELRIVERPVVDGNQYDGVCACLRDYPGFVDFLSCPSSIPFIKRVAFTRCEDNNFIPIGVDCLRF